MKRITVLLVVVLAFVSIASSRASSVTSPNKKLLKRARVVQHDHVVAVATMASVLSTRGASDKNGPDYDLYKSVMDQLVTTDTEAINRGAEQFNRGETTLTDLLKDLKAAPQQHYLLTVLYNKLNGRIALQDACADQADAFERGCQFGCNGISNGDF